jgi:hypothetical protein
MSGKTAKAIRRDANYHPSYERHYRILYNRKQKDGTMGPGSVYLDDAKCSRPHYKEMKKEFYDRR